MNDVGKSADVCIIAEGCYPYVSGGVSSWIHTLISSQQKLTFSVVSILPYKFDEPIKYKFPNNVIFHKNVHLQKMPSGKSKLKSDINIGGFLETTLLKLFKENDLKAFKELIDFVKKNKKELGYKILFQSEITWYVITEMYKKTMNNSSFLDYFWSWKNILGSIFSILMDELPQASCYHAVSTGYAGLYLAKAHFETSRPVILTEHGIYTNERKIEIATADWLYDHIPFNLSVEKGLSYGLQEMWTDSFTIFSKLCYDVCSDIITLFEGNVRLQLLDGAKPEKIKIIPNGIDYAKFSKIPRVKKDRPVAALIGRVVQIKDVKTFIKSIDIVRSSTPDIKAYIIGSTDEEPDYFEECKELVQALNLQDNITFTGNVNVVEHLGGIDVVVLSSLSEGQPLVILECGAAGIPTVATDVGSCRELILGKKDELPKLGDGGIVTPLVNPNAIAFAIHKLLSDFEFYKSCSSAIKKRVNTYYTLEQQSASYEEIYLNLLNR